MKKSRRKRNIIFNPIKSPYNIRQDNNTVSDYYHRYISDDKAIIEIKGRVYYKIIDLYEFRRQSVSALALLDTRLNLKIDDKLIDENGWIYNIKSFEMVRLSTVEFPDWYMKVIFVVLDGDPYKMGDYLAKYDG